jgi:vanadium chloroperoxidase
MQVIRQVAIARGNSELENASLFCLANLAMADAGTLSWQQKYKSFYYRPATGMAANGVETWKPLGAPRSNQTDGAASFTPNFPAYPSGHATFGAAALHTLRLFYPASEGGVTPGDKKNDGLLDTLTFVSDELDGRTTDSKGQVRPRVPRKHPGGLWEMIVANGFSRVFLG